MTWLTQLPVDAEGYWWFRAKKSGGGFQKSAGIVLVASAAGKTVAYTDNKPVSKFIKFWRGLFSKKSTAYLLIGPSVDTSKLSCLWSGPIKQPEE